MTKRLLSLLLAIVMVLSLCMTACSSEPTKETGEEEENAEEEVQRNNLALTIYAIKDKKTTDEALAAVEEKVSNYCVAKYKTAIDLRFFTEEEYMSGLNDMYDKFAAQAEAEKQAAAEKAKKEKEEAAYIATLSKEEKIKYEQEKRQQAKEEAEAAEKEKEEQAELIEQGKDKAVVKDVQMDILFLPSMKDYYSHVDQGLLFDIKNYLGGKYKRIDDYVFPSYLTAATVNGGIFGIPNNQAISTNETFLLVKTDLAEKYNVKFDSIRSITDLADVYAQIVANEPGVAPIYGDWDPEGLAYYEEVDSAHTICVFTDTLLGGKFTGINAYSALNPESSQGSAFVDWCATKAEYRKAGYLSDTNENFFVSVKELTEEEKAAWEAKGYTPVLYKGADFNTKAALDTGLFCISKHCAQPERAMEILQLMTTDAELHNLLTFGIEDVHYTRTQENSNIITIIDDSYSMDFFKTGNALIGYLPDTMDPDFFTKSQEKNRNSFMNPFLGFRFDWSNPNMAKWLKLFEEWKVYYDPIYEQLRYGTDNYMELLDVAYDTTYNNRGKIFSDSYSNWSKNGEFRNTYKAYVTTLAKLDSLLHFDSSVAAD